jgi:hypothetical protein
MYVLRFDKGYLIKINHRKEFNLLKCSQVLIKIYIPIIINIVIFVQGLNIYLFSKYPKILEAFLKFVDVEFSVTVFVMNLENPF